ncbi:galactose-specific lectin nattectin [Anarhichas minor]|uniref:galactose-specific lectin nattectin n=1 Tax=Anarhichas minor TaxID=65739 RepID=UPI003F73B387
MKALSVSLVLGFFLTLSRAAPLNSTYPMKMMMMGGDHENMDKPHPMDMEMEMEPYCPYGWTHYEHECFIFINSNKTWIEAEKYCLFVGGNLVSIHSYEQNHFLQSLTEDGTHSFPLTWIGATDAVHLNAWLWSDGSKFDCENWTRGYRMNETERCLEMNYGLHKKWINAPCDKCLPFICGKMM